MRPLVLSCAVLAIGAALCPASLSASTPVCVHKTWVECSGAIKDAVDKDDGSDPKRIFDYAVEWNTVFDARFNQLRKSGMIEPSFPDSEQITEAIAEKLNPVAIAKDKTRELLIKALLPRVAFLLEWTSSPFVAGLKAFLSSSETASEYDELVLSNDDVQKAVEKKMAPYMQPDWKTKLTVAVDAAAPQLRQR